MPSWWFSSWLQTSKAGALDRSKSVSALRISQLTRRPRRSTPCARFGLVRVHVSSQQTRRGMALHELPDDVVILVLQRCRILDIFNLRLTCRHVENTISAYEKTIVPEVAQTTFPRPENDHLYWSAGEDYSLRWLKGFIPRYLAATLLEGPSFRSVKFLGWSSIMSIDPLGDELRSRLANGWCIVKKLSNISQAVYSPPVTRLANSFNAQTWSHIQSSLHSRLALGKGRETQDFAFISQKEEMIATRRREYIASLSKADAASYMLLIRLLSKAIRYHPRFESAANSALAVINTALARKLSRYFDYPGKFRDKYIWYTDWLNDTPCPITPWVLWAVLHIGPDPFFVQWTSRYEQEEPKADHVAELITSLTEGQDGKSISRRGKLAAQIDIELRRKCLRDGIEKSWMKSYVESKGGKMKREAMDEVIQRGTSDHKLFVKEAMLPQYFMRWRAAGGENAEVNLTEEEQVREEELIHSGRHPREKVPFFVFLGREPAADEMKLEEGG
ncbi:uncharacterized protein PV09_08480 [Verruconis gallopava]|uniref:F-box domain-containing protein n=1 Tax=Verruconis gallopava TaxID=253628 RepID=A0A0D2A111_9PEZI|nr:uncharacterized protein PV09_08480 [Verruconis gallopava]KIV99969.1 hypothetical protein PV09_08480 [Verruconis gallopava]